MGDIFASCGHRLGEGSVGNDITTIEYDKEEKPGWCHMTVCDECLKWYQNNNLVIRDAERQMRRGETPHV